MSYSEASRLIFPYSNGTRDVKGDPLRLRRLLTQRLGDYRPLVDRVNAIDAARDDMAVILDGLAAQQELIDGAREVFGLAPYDDATGQGATDAHALAVLSAYNRFLSEQKKTPESPPTSSPPSPAPSPAAA